MTESMATVNEPLTLNENMSARTIQAKETNRHPLTVSESGTHVRLYPASNSSLLDCRLKWHLGLSLFEKRGADGEREG